MFFFLTCVLFLFLVSTCCANTPCNLCGDRYLLPALKDITLCVFCRTIVFSNQNVPQSFTPGERSSEMFLEAVSVVGVNSPLCLQITAAGWHRNSSLWCELCCGVGRRKMLGVVEQLHGRRELEHGCETRRWRLEHERKSSVLDYLSL